jgi:hypothetical protein
MPVASGHGVNVSFLFEDNGFASSPNDSTHKPFGQDARLTTRDATNSLQRVSNPGSRDTNELVETNFEGSWAVEMNLSATEWLQLLYGSPSSTSNTDSTTLSYTPDTLPTSFQIVEGTQATGAETLLQGCIVTSASIDLTQGEVATVSLEGNYATEDHTPSTSLTSQPSVSEDTLAFQDATLNRDGSELDLMQSASLTLNPNVRLVYDFGSRTAEDFGVGRFETELTGTRVVNSDDDKTRIYGGASATSPQTDITNEQDMTFTFDNGRGGADIKTVTFNVSGATPESFSRANIGDPDSNLEDELSEMALSVSVDVENGDNL